MHPAPSRPESRCQAIGRLDRFAQRQAFGCNTVHVDVFQLVHQTVCTGCVHIDQIGAATSGNDDGFQGATLTAVPTANRLQERIGRDAGLVEHPLQRDHRRLESVFQTAKDAIVPLGNDFGHRFHAGDFGVSAHRHNHGFVTGECGCIQRIGQNFGGLCAIRGQPLSQSRRLGRVIETGPQALGLVAGLVTLAHGAAQRSLNDFDACLEFADALFGGQDGALHFRNFVKCGVESFQRLFGFLRAGVAFGGQGGQTRLIGDLGTRRLVAAGPGCDGSDQKERSDHDRPAHHQCPADQGAGLGQRTESDEACAFFGFQEQSLLGQVTFQFRVDLVRQPLLHAPFPRLILTSRVRPEFSSPDGPEFFIRFVISAGSRHCDAIGQPFRPVDGRNPRVLDCPSVRCLRSAASRNLAEGRHRHVFRR